MPLTNAQKQEALRKRRALEGLQEIRGTWAQQKYHRAIKDMIKNMMRNIEKK